LALGAPDRPLRVLIAEPYDAGSHAAWLRGLQAHSRHTIETITLPGRFWKWRMHGGALTLSRLLRERGTPAPDVLLASDMLDVAAFVSLARSSLAGTAIGLYFHENQLAYPTPRAEPEWDASRRRRAARRDEHYPFINLTSALCADRVFWNSAHNRDSFLEALPAFLGRFPDFREPGAAAAVAQRSEVLPLGLELRALRPAAQARLPGPPRIVWNHRWEHDKDPETFFEVVGVLAEEGLAFELIVLGERFVREPPVFARAKKALGARIRHWGFVDSRADYAAWLQQGDIVVSTARHEFFGAAMCEAVACGCLPLAPRRLSYPEVFARSMHEQVLYDDEQDLARRLRLLLDDPATVEPIETHPLKAALAAAVARYDWSNMAPRYDAALTSLARRADGGAGASEAASSGA
jgi:glycosyltransferase involved in cell wall biosynthesis